MKNKQFEAWALPILKKYQAVLLLQDHTLDLTYRKELVTENTLMEHGFNYPYKHIGIHYGNKAVEYFKNKNKKELYDCLIHELCHSVTDPLYNVAYERFLTRDALTNERERLTDHIANIIIKNVT